VHRRLAFGGRPPLPPCVLTVPLQGGGQPGVGLPRVGDGQSVGFAAVRPEVATAGAAGAGRRCTAGSGWATGRICRRSGRCFYCGEGRSGEGGGLLIAGGQ